MAETKKNSPVDAEPAPLEVVKPDKDAHGNQWTVDRISGGYHVTLTTKTGRQSSTTTATEDEARELLKAHVK